MRKVIATLFASLDGFATDRDEEMRWVTDNFGEETGKYVLDRTRGTLVLGRVTYESFAAYWPTARREDEGEFVDRMNSIPRVVFSKTLEGPLAWSNSTLARGDLAEEISRLKQQPGEDIGIAGSVTLVQALLKLGLIDRLRLLVHPVVLGSDGKKPIFEGCDPTELELVGTTVLDSRVVVLEYRPLSRGES